MTRAVEILMTNAEDMRKLAFDEYAGAARILQLSLKDLAQSSAEYRLQYLSIAARRHRDAAKAAADLFHAENALEAMKELHGLMESGK